MEKKAMSAVDYVADCIKNELIEEKLKPGDRLPTEPELAQKYGVGRNSVREAIKQLQAFGILYIHRPDGTFVSESYNEKMLDPMLYSLILRAHDWQDFVQLRMVIDIGTLYAALDTPGCERVVPELNLIIEECREEMNRPEPSVDRVLQLDLEFHQTIIRVMRNPQVESVTSYIAKLTVPSRRRVVENWLRSGEKETFLDLHRQIARVLEYGQKNMVTEVVKNHYINWE